MLLRRMRELGRYHENVFELLSRSDVVMDSVSQQAVSLFDVFFLWVLLPVLVVLPLSMVMGSSYT